MHKSREDRQQESYDECCYLIRIHSNPGIYGVDEENNPWATFSTINSTHACHECGKQITMGWMRGKLGEAIYVCSKHVKFSKET
jgi:hypothetical protein